jgi:hypothetical protein
MRFTCQIRWRRRERWLAAFGQLLIDALDLPADGGRDFADKCRGIGEFPTEWQVKVEGFRVFFQCLETLEQQRGMSRFA